MATNIVGSLTPEQAIARGQDVVDVLLQDWGSSVDDAYPILTASGVLGLSFTPAAVMIGPWSTVDRCWATWNSQSNGLGFERGVIKPLSVDTPISFALPGNNTGTPIRTGLINPDAPDTAQFYNELFFFPQLVTPQSGSVLDVPPGTQSALQPTQYVKTDGSTSNFGPDNIARNCLHLRFFLKAGVIPFSTKRFPYQVDSGDVFNTLPAGAEYALVYVPIFGRKKIVVRCAANKAGAVFRVGMLRNSNASSGLYMTPVYETTDGEKTATVANTSLKFEFCEPLADWMVLYVTPALNATAVNFTVTAYD